MKKSILCFAVATVLAGCADDSSHIDCGHGHAGGPFLCICDEGYMRDSRLSCTICDEGYIKNGLGECKKANGGDGNGDCTALFSYYNPYTSVSTGGESDFNVYLVGDFNDWLAPDGNTLTSPTKDHYKMVADGKGNHVFLLKVEKGKTYKYKYYVDGWDANSWQTDPAGVSDSEGNSIANITSCGMEFGETNNAGNGKCTATFTFYNQYTSVGSGGTADFDVYLVGEFNDWLKAVDGLITSPDKDQYKMKSDGKGNHTITIEVEEGKAYKYKYYVSGWEGNAWQSDPANPSVDGEGNSIANIDECGLSFGKAGGNDGGGGDPVIPKGNLIKSISVTGQTITVNLEDGVNITGVAGGVNPQFSGSTLTDTVNKNTRYNYDITTDKGDVYAPVWVEPTPFDWRDALLYFAFTDRFFDGDSSNNEPRTDATHDGTADARWLGGDFKGLKQKVEEGYFTNLGVNTLWISSVSMNTQGTSQGTDNKSYSAYHSYWPITTFMTDSNQSEFQNLSAIEPHFGTMDDLRALVDACHERGIRVLVDFAANHVHRDSPIFKNHKNWFNDVDNAQLCDSNDNWNRAPETCWFSADLPDIDYRNAEARKLMVDHAIWLIKKTGVDGFRVDAVKHMHIQFIRDLRAAVDALFKNTGIMFYMVGETFDGNPDKLNAYIGSDLLHAQFDFALYFAITGMLKGDGNMSAVFNAGQTSISEHSPYKSNLMGTFIGNHDVARAISVAAGHSDAKWAKNPEVTDPNAYLKVKQALTMLLTQPGVPLLYYGDEYGMEGANDPDNRRMMEFDNYNEQQGYMIDYVSRLGKIRASQKAITRGKRTDIVRDGNLWCYKMEHNGETVIVGIGGLDPRGKTCPLGSQTTLINLLSDDHSEMTTSELRFDAMSRYQIYRVK